MSAPSKLLDAIARNALIVKVNEIIDAFADYVPTTRKVNGKALSADITISASDIGVDVSGKLDKSGGTMTGYLTAVSNPTVGTGGVRNIYVSTSAPTSGQGANGDIWIKL